MPSRHDHPERVGSADLHVQRDVPERKSSAELHNDNCRRYIDIIWNSMPSYVKDTLPASIFLRLTEATEESRAVLYHDLMTWLESRLTEPDIANREDPNLDDFIISLYDNDNGNLERTFAHIKHITMDSQPGNQHTQQNVSLWLEDNDDEDERGFRSPADTDTRLNRLQAVTTDDYKPQLYTNIPARRKTPYVLQYPAVEIRMSTQGQRHQDVERVNPLFELFLQAQKRIRQRENPGWDGNGITHVYFNQLARDRNWFDYEGQREARLTTALHDLETRHTNVAVITVPADKGLMSHGDVLQVEAHLPAEQVFQQLLQIASHNSPTSPPIHDFHISESVRRKLFPQNRRILNELLEQCFAEMGVQMDQRISPARRQAIWVHFTKYHLPLHVIGRLQPDHYNMSCKDAIDRGGIASAYFHLMNSIQLRKPITREEFECALHAAPAMVKGRGMNDHLNVIWNAVDAYIQAQGTQNVWQQIPWLLAWRDSNCPHKRVDDLLLRRIADVEALLNASGQRDPSVEKARNILNHVRLQQQQGVSGKRLFLATVSHLTDLLYHPTHFEIERFETLANEMEIRYPALQFLAGLIKTFVAALLVLPSMGYSLSWMDDGLATTKAAIHVDTRRELQQRMRAEDHHTNTNDDSESDDHPNQP